MSRSAWYSKNRESIRAKQREYYRQNKEKFSASNRKWRKANPKASIKFIKAARERLRSEVLQVLGNQCIQCGFNDPRALQIDHIHGGGRKDRKEKTSPWAFLKDIKLNGAQGKFQLLCANCNSIKRVVNQEHRKI